MKKTRLPSLLSLLLCNSCIMQPLVSNISEMEEAEKAPIPTLVGKSSSTRWFWFWNTGDDSVELALKNGGISNISSITKTRNSYFGIVVQNIPTVRGE
jgi:hypothetical protein